jgi:hypothetical protein
MLGSSSSSLSSSSSSSSFLWVVAAAAINIRNGTTPAVNWGSSALQGWDFVYSSSNFWSPQTQRLFNQLRIITFSRKSERNVLSDMCD